MKNLKFYWIISCAISALLAILYLFINISALLILISCLCSTIMTYIVYKQRGISIFLFVLWLFITSLWAYNYAYQLRTYILKKQNIELLKELKEQKQINEDLKTYNT